MASSEIIELVQQIQGNVARVRNICVIAHVDHGKTALSDTLLASNGIISVKQAGEARYMDSREDEQLRGITMKSSSIALLFNYKNDEVENKAIHAMVAQSNVVTHESAMALGHKLKTHVLEAAVPGADASLPVEARALLYRSVFANRVTGPHLIQLIDSPGHIDFSSEVSAAVRMSDGAVVVVDVVEGMCVQTHNVLRQAWDENVKVCLVLNKFDRLITELRLTPLEAYHQAKKVVEQVNATLNTLAAREREGKMNVHEDEGNDVELSPVIGNVVFCSAVHGWAFSVSQFAALYAKRLGMKADVLARTMWGEFFFSPKAKTVVRSNPAQKLKPTFVQFALDNVWAMYNAVLEGNDFEKLSKMVTALDLKVQPRDLKSKNKTATLQTIMSKWLPAHQAIMSMIVQHLPSPAETQPFSVPHLFRPRALATARAHPPLASQPPSKEQEGREGREGGAVEDLERIVDACMKCDKESDVVVACIAKVFAVSKDALPKRRSNTKQQQPGEGHPEEGAKEEAKEEAKGGGEGEEELATVLVCATRVYSGTLALGQRLFVYGARYDPSNPGEHRSEVVISELYLQMGRELARVDAVPAGNVCCVGGLDKVVLKTGTLCSLSVCLPVAHTLRTSAPIMRVAIEPESPAQLSLLRKALKWLNSADPALDVVVQASGEHVLLVQGEVHLQRCIKDLSEITNNMRLRVSPPIVSFRESVVPDNVAADRVLTFAPVPGEDDGNSDSDSDAAWPPPPLRPVVVGSGDGVGDGDGDGEEGEGEDGVEGEEKGKQGDEGCDHVQSTPNGRLSFVVRACSLPLNVTRFLLRNQPALKAWGSGDSDHKSAVEGLFAEMRRAGKHWGSLVERVWCVGPRRSGANLLVNAVTLLGGDLDDDSWLPLHLADQPSRLSKVGILGEVGGSVLAGFDLACAAGPLCEEPTQGVCYLVCAITEHPIEDQGKSVYGPFSGQVISTMKEGCRKAFSRAPQRLVEAMYVCDLEATAEVLGKLYGVIGKRRGRIIKEEMQEGTAAFAIRALVPVAESFGFAEELRKRTSGSAMPQLVFSHWEVLNVDPFWQPSTELEMEDFGEDGKAVKNVARDLMNAVRKRKGLFVQEKIVEHAEKQRTLQRKK